MFGKGGALSSWLREFGQLVFIQTIQAFIYAIIISVIMAIYDTAIDRASADALHTDYATGLGFFAVVALVSVFKVEDMARKIFGIGSTKADHGSAVKDIAKTAIAVNLGKRVLDNGKKVVGGTKNWLGGRKDEKKAADRLERRKQALYKDMGMDDETNKLSTPATQQAGGAGSVLATSKNDEKAKLLAKAKKSRMLAITETDPTRHKALMDEAQQYESMASGLSDTIVESESGGSASLSASAGGSSTGRSTGTSQSTKSGNYHQKMLDLQEQYEKEISSIKKRRKEGFRTMTKGVMEMGGSVVGATAGGILGFAGGDIDEGLRSVVSGAGVGDVVGETVANVSFGTEDAISSAYKATSSAIKDYSSSIKSQYEEERKNVSSQITQMNNEASAEVKRINKEVEKARESLENDVELSTRQTVTAMKNAVKKGTTKAYKSRHGGLKQLETGLKDLQSHMSNSTATKHIPLNNNVESID